MQDKLEKILTQIAINDDSYEFFSNGILEKVIVKDNIKLWEIIIRVENILPNDVYIELENKIRDTFNKIEVIRVRINSNSLDYNEINKYYNYLIDIISKNNVRYNSFKDRNINLNNNVLSIEVYNDVEKSN